MPGFDGTGPKGTGPMTGRGLGYCVVPFEDSPRCKKPDMPHADIYEMHLRPVGYLSYGFNPSNIVPHCSFFRTGNGRYPEDRGRFFGRGRGFKIR